MPAEDQGPNTRSSRSIGREARQGVAHATLSPGGTVGPAPQRVAGSLVQIRGASVASTDIGGPQAAASAAAAADSGVVPGQFVVLFKDNISDVAAAVARSHAAATYAMAAGGVAVAAAQLGPASWITAVSVSEPPPGSTGVPGHAVFSSAPGLDPATIRAALAAHDDVAAVVPNVIIRISQGSSSAGSSSGCVGPEFAGGTVAAPSQSLGWAGCLGPNLPTALAAFGERCGPSLSQFRWTGLFAYNRTTGLLYRDCVALRSSYGSAAQQQLFGECGSSPAVLPALPTQACPEAAGSSCVDGNAVSSYRPSLSSAFCGATSITLAGVPCGPNGALVQWNKMTPGRRCVSVSRDATTGDLKKQADWLGQCGVPPAQITGLPTRICGKLPTSAATQPSPSPSPSPAPSPSPIPSRPPAAALPQMQLAPGENSALWGMARIGAYDAASNTVVDASAAIAATGYKVVLVDTGADAGHPDLNVVEFNDLLDAPGTAYYGKDGNGHGTHVAGTIGAKNNGAGVFGVVPGMPIIAYKVLGADGSGVLSTAWTAYADILARLQRGERIAAINLSLGATSTDATVRATECSWVKKIAAYGVAVVAAAGNDYGNLLTNTLPAACDDATAVTSLDAADQPSDFSNLAYTSSPQAMKDRMIAAPGSTITSTYPGNSYASLSGTSMATPHVTGAYAKCFLSGACRLSSSPDTPAVTVNIPVMQAAAQAPGCNTTLCGPRWGSARSFFGFAANVRQW